MNSRAAPWEAARALYDRSFARLPVCFRGGRNLGLYSVEVEARALLNWRIFNSGHRIGNQSGAVRKF